MAWGKEILRSKVVVGAHHLDHPGSGDYRVTEHTIKKAKYHINYNKDTTDADVAVIGNTVLFYLFTISSTRWRFNFTGFFHFGTKLSPGGAF